MAGGEGGLLSGILPCKVDGLRERNFSLSFSGSLRCLIENDADRSKFTCVCALYSSPPGVVSFRHTAFRI